MTIDGRIEPLTMNLECMSHQIEQHNTLLGQDGEHIRALVRLAEIHERRLK